VSDSNNPSSFASDNIISSSKNKNTEYAKTK
jgi:hypothetical protein